MRICAESRCSEDDTVRNSLKANLMKRLLSLSMGIYNLE